MVPVDSVGGGSPDMDEVLLHDPSHSGIEFRRYRQYCPYSACGAGRSVDDGLYTTINLAKVQSIKDRILNELRSSGIKDVNVDIVTNTANIDFDIKYVYVDVSNLSLSDNSQHINTNEVIKSVVIKISKVREEQVIIYG